LPRGETRVVAAGANELKEIVIQIRVDSVVRQKRISGGDRGDSNSWSGSRGRDSLLCWHGSCVGLDSWCCSSKGSRGGHSCVNRCDGGRQRSGHSRSSGSRACRNIDAGSRAGIRAGLRNRRARECVSVGVEGTATVYDCAVVLLYRDDPASEATFWVAHVQEKLES